MVMWSLDPWVSCHWTWEEGPWAKLWNIHRRPLSAGGSCISPGTLFQPLLKSRHFLLYVAPVPESRDSPVTSLDLVKNRNRKRHWTYLLMMRYYSTSYWCFGFCFFVLRGIPTHRSWVRKIRFAPGKGNQKLIAMYNDGAEVWDTKEVGPAPRGYTANEAAGHRNYVFFSSFWFRNENYVMGLSSWLKVFFL